MKETLETDQVKSLETLYPKIKFRLVGVDLSDADFMNPIVESTSDISINLVFNNAGNFL